MIVPMKKVFLVARADVRDRLLAALRELGVVHLEPVDPAAGAPADLLDALSRTRRAQRAIAGLTPGGVAPDLDPAAATAEILDIVARSEQHRTRLGALHRQAVRLAVWGDLRRDRLDALAEAGVPVRFYSVPRADVGQVRAECVVALAALPGKRQLIGVVHRDGEPGLPDGAEPLAAPEQDIHAVRAEARAVDAALAADAERLGELARLSDALVAHERGLADRAVVAAAQAGGLAGDDLFALQGWAPAEGADALAADLGGRGLDAAVRTREPADDEEPPTLVRYPRWARPIQGLFDILGTNPGYREHDLSGFFMIALPIFAAMLIGDAGYGLLFMLVPLAFRARLIRAAGRAKTNLLLTIGVMTTAWGVLTANYFGVTPADLAGGAWAPVGEVMAAMAPLWRSDAEAGRFLVIKISFVLGCIHLICAHARQAAGYWPNPKAWAEVGWCGVLAGMLGVIWVLFFGQREALPAWLPWAAVGLLAGGYVLAVLFAYPDKPAARRVGVGLAASLLPMLGTFSDTMSYIRLMAVGLASYYIASAFNGLGAMAGAASPWLWLVGVPVIVFGHALNIALAVIAIFAHGVRLNMLEFSNNAGVQWAGYAYAPFRTSPSREES